MGLIIQEQELTPPPDAISKVDAYRRTKETSVLCVVFADIVGSTELLEKMGEVRYDALRQEHNQTVVDVFETGGVGAVVQVYGDGALAVFSEPSSCVMRCLELQEVLKARSSFPLRIGVDMGQVTQTKESGVVVEIFSRQVNRAARIEALAPPGGVLTSFNVYDCAVGWLRDTVSWIHQGEEHLKGFSDPISLHRPVYQPVALPNQGAVRLLGGDAATGEDDVNYTPTPGAPSAPGDARYEPQREAVLPSRKNDGGRRLAGNTHLPMDPCARALEEIRLLTHRKRGIWRIISRPSLRTARILWVDDHPENNEWLISEFEFAGLSVLSVTNSDDAMAALAKHSFAAVITDMERGSNATAGLDLLRWRRESEISVPFLLFESPTVIAEYGDEARTIGAKESTAGSITLVRSLVSSLSGE